jgi:hypothetical protein
LLLERRGEIEVKGKGKLETFWIQLLPQPSFEPATLKPLSAAESNLNVASVNCMDASGQVYSRP